MGIGAPGCQVQESKTGKDPAARLIPLQSPRTPSLMMSQRRRISGRLL
jgi:hypothetical protein